MIYIHIFLMIKIIFDVKLTKVRVLGCDEADDPISGKILPHLDPRVSFIRYQAPDALAHI